MELGADRAGFLGKIDRDALIGSRGAESPARGQDGGGSGAGAHKKPAARKIPVHSGIYDTLCGPRVQAFTAFQTLRSSISETPPCFVAFRGSFSPTRSRACC